ncbi:MAG: hypothetical protein PUJ57_04675 [Peptoniphilaceae bacterium]|nr:hypothetical protein [Peptoniphilaceae bacterium]
MLPWDYNLAFGTFQGGLSQMPGMTQGKPISENDDPSSFEKKGGLDGMPAMSGNLDPSNLPEDFDPSQMPSEVGGQVPGMNEIPEGSEPSQRTGGFTGERPEEFDASQMPGDESCFNRNSVGNTTSSGANLIWLAVSVAVLCMGLMIAKRYKKY